MFGERKPGVYYGNSLISDKEYQAVKEVILSQNIFRYYGQGENKKVKEFEEKIKEFFSVNEVLCVSSGTAALKCALKALNIKPGDKVIVPSYGFLATVNAVVSCGGIPIFCDIDYSMNMDAEKLKLLIKEGVKAVICVHIGGEAANIEKISKITKENDIFLIEDTAQAFGAKFKDRYLGTFGDIGCFSFQANKILSTGEGGCLISNNKELICKANIYHDQGGIRHLGGFPSWTNNMATFGENFRMTEITGAIGLEQIKRIPDILENLYINKNKLLKLIENLNFNFRQKWEINTGCNNNVVIFLDSQKERDMLIKDLEKFGVHKNYNSAIFENYLFNKEGGFFKLFEKYTPNDINIYNCNNAIDLSKRSMWIPIYLGNDDVRIQQIACELEKYFRS